ncbi:MAG: hypothetical protein ACREBJ_10165 [Nitrosotalea sp.]
MVRISTKSAQEQQAIIEAKRRWHKDYHNNPERKAIERAYQKEYRTRPGVRESHKKAQEAYIKSEKGRATRDRYLQRLDSTPGGLDNAGYRITTTLRPWTYL